MLSHAASERGTGGGVATAVRPEDEEADSTLRPIVGSEMLDVAAVVRTLAPSFLSEGALPQSFLLEGALSRSFLSKGTLSRSFLSERALPRFFLSEGALPA